MSEGRTVVLAAVVATVVAVIVAFCTSVVFFALHDARSDATTASSWRSERAAVGTDVGGSFADSSAAARTYRFQIPDDAVQVDLSVKSEDGDVDLRAHFGEAPPAAGGDWDLSADADDGRTKLVVTRHAEAAFRPGPLLVELSPAASHHGKNAIAYTLRADVVPVGTPAVVVAGQPIDAVTEPSKGHRCDLVVDVPRGIEALRIDVVDADRDVDLLASSEGPALDGALAQWDATGPLARESLVLDAKDDAEAFGRRLWFAVVDPSVYDAPVRFRVTVTFAKTPPAEALVLPRLVEPADARDRAVASVVEIVVGDFIGSGTIVRADGLILTARHVVGDRTGEEGDIAVALDLDPTKVTRDLFHAKVLRSDEDLDVALLHITSGLFGQELPRGYRFPACPIAFDAAPRLGDPLVTIGFPEPAGTGTRAPVLLSRGVVSGFEREKSGVRIKTDAFIAAGSSGGAALDDRFRLIGVPVFYVTASEGASQMGFLVQVSELPQDWREMIAK